MSAVEHVSVQPEEAGRRLDTWFKDHFPRLPRGRLEKLLRTGQIRIDGKRVKSNVRLEAWQVVRVPPLKQDDDKAFKGPKPVGAEDRAFMQGLVLHEDKAVIALNKPAGLAVQGGSKTERHLDGLLAGLVPEGAERPRLVHRLDKETSGVLLVAKSSAYAAKLGKNFKSRQARKTYWALVKGVPRPEQGTIRLGLAKLGGGAGGERMVAENDPQAPEAGVDWLAAVTHYSVIAQAGQRYAWLALRPETGRTHQLRAHLAAIGHPIIGDFKYGREEAEVGGDMPGGMYLHARAIEVPSPLGGTLAVEAPLPPHMAQAWALFAFEAEDAEGAFDLLDGAL
ncbi:MAG: RluA family pseudouridine synthase [Alphaproteobacteria bacterium]|nr:MAG: RluA family pseudouridine synthase [Alphaproteobacteria bacterium]